MVGILITCTPWGGPIGQFGRFAAKRRAMIPTRARGRAFWATSMNEVTRILAAIEQGDHHAAERFLPLVYAELRRLAASQLAQEKPGQTLAATALVHEAYLRLVGDQHFENRRHFFAAAAEAMRRILVDNARRKQRDKHGGRLERRTLDQIDVAALDASEDLLALEDALQKLTEADATAA